MEPTKPNISYEDCQKQICGVCAGCGGKLEPLETVDNFGQPTFWAGCKKCSTFDYGVSPRIYGVAQKLVDEQHFVCYRHLMPKGGESQDTLDYYRVNQIRGTCDLVTKVLNVYEKVRNHEQ